MFPLIPTTTPLDNPFKWRQFEPELILLCVRWYLRYALSYRDLEEMMSERAPEIDTRCRPHLKRSNDSYRIDETYVRVGGAWKYLYHGSIPMETHLIFCFARNEIRPLQLRFFARL